MIDLLDCDDPLRSENPLEAEELQVHRFQRQLYLVSDSLSVALVEALKSFLL
jgi:hypothetical protein